VLTLWVRGIAFHYKTDPLNPRLQDLVRPEYGLMCVLADRVVFQTPKAAFVRKDPREKLPHKSWVGREWDISYDEIRVTLDGHRLRVHEDPQDPERKEKVSKMLRLMAKVHGKALS
jgi:hypothetical protein